MPDLYSLVGLFYRRPEELAQFRRRAISDLPPVARRLLAHNEHMTETVEAFHDTPVSVEVLHSVLEGHHYRRKILLRRRTDGRVVQFGLVRLDFAVLDPVVQKEIVDQQIPLGRVLISHDVLRQVEMIDLWEVNPADELRSLLGMRPGEVTYGRTALIHCNGEPAVELLEVVTPA